MIWEQYVFRRGREVEELWDQTFADKKSEGRSVKLLYVTGRGFDIRAGIVLSRYVERLKASECTIDKAELLLVGFSDYQMSDELNALTERNEAEIQELFADIGSSKKVWIGSEVDGEDDISSTISLKRAADKIVHSIGDHTDVVLDVSSLPRLAYLTIMLALLARIVPRGAEGKSLFANGLTLQVLAAEDAILDSQIHSEDPSGDLTFVPSYSEALQSEAQRDDPLVWFPMLGEDRLGQLSKVEEVIPAWAEICPVLPHPSRNPRRGDRLLVEYDGILFGRRETPTSNIMLVNESHPFEVYRQLLGAMRRFRKTMGALGTCRFVITPLASKLMTVGSALACFEMKMHSADYLSSVAIPYAEPRRYTADLERVMSSMPTISALVLTGDAYDNR